MSEVAKEVGKSEKTVQRLRTIANLIPELSAMLDSKAITQKVAYAPLPVISYRGQNSFQGPDPKKMEL